jgi:hypothetical protein
MRLALTVMVMCAGCDALFNLDHVPSMPIDASGDGSGRIDAMVDARDGSRAGFVQVTSATSNGGVTVNKSYSFDQTAGDLNVVFIGWTSSGSHVTSVTDTAGNAYALGVAEGYGNVLGQTAYYAANIKPGPNTVSVTFNQTTENLDLRIVEYAGVATADALDTSVSTVSSGMVATTGTFITTAPHTIVVAGFMMSGAATGAGNGCTERIITGVGNLVEDFEKLTAGGGEATAPQDQNGAYIGQAAVFAVP